ncbi:cytochrome c oxidase subunit II [bacterium]|nr:cytochrome c oxidase subunit II [bacterium]
MFKDKDIRNLVAIWVVGTLLAFASAALVYSFYSPAAPGGSPTETSPITNWIFQPSTTVAEMVRVNTAWTVAVIFPFLFAPIITLLYIIGRFNEKNNPVPATFHEHLPLEVFWTIVPAVVLVAMAVPAYGVLRYMEKPPTKPDLVVDVVGAQFYWQYTLPKYDVTVTDEGDGKDPLVLPVDKAILLNGQSFQVNHAWWVPAFGVKFDVIPGRINTSWIRTKREGSYKGQCAELCGTLHAYMLIHVNVVPEKEFYQWLKKKGAKFPPEEQEYVAALLGEDVTATALATSTTTNH